MMRLALAGKWGRPARPSGAPAALGVTVVLAESVRDAMTDGPRIEPRAAMPIAEAVWGRNVRRLSSSWRRRRSMSFMVPRVSGQSLVAVEDFVQVQDRAGGQRVGGEVGGVEGFVGRGRADGDQLCG